MNNLALKPVYWASVSGGKDSLFMLYLILNNPDKYKLDGVVHYCLEIDYPLVFNVRRYIRDMCRVRNIPYVEISPSRSWYSLYNEYGFPNRQFRWCNSKYKMEAKNKLVSFLRSRGEDCYFYIGFCLDEQKRMKRVSRSMREIYPIAELGYSEEEILLWAKKQPIFNDYYKFNRRMGCMYCPLASRLNLAYLLKYYPDNYSEMFRLIRETEKKNSELGRPFSVFDGKGKYDSLYVDRCVRTKWLPRLVGMIDDNI